MTIRTRSPKPIVPPCRSPILSVLPKIGEEFARLILEATYEATLCAALLNASKTGNNTVFLTLVGGGVFGNETDWILGSLQRALDLYQQAALDVAIVSYKWPNSDIQHLVSHTDYT